MPSLATLLSLALLPAAALAAPFDQGSSAIRLTGRALASTRGNLTFTENVARDLSGLEAKLRNLNSEAAKRAAAKLKKRAATVPLKVQVKNGWLQTHAGNVNIGTPAQTLPVLFDTGSYDLVMPVDCTDGCPNGYFHAASSSSFTNLTTPAKTSYAGGAYPSGYVAQDRVTIGSYSLDGQRFLAASDFEGPAANYAGILGLAPYSGSVVGGLSFFDRLVTSGSLKNNLFSTWFTKSVSGGVLVLDGIDSTKYTGDLVQVPVVAPGYWLVQTAGYTWHNMALDSTSTLTLVDSGTAYNYIPRSAAAALAAKISGTRLETVQQVFLGQLADVDIYQVPCRVIYQGGLGFKFTGQSSSAPLTMNVIDNISDFETVDGVKTCYASFVGVDVTYQGAPASLLGLPFLQSFYTVWSYGASGEDLSLSFAVSKRS